ncbi:MAG TPA: VWA domain-containing protein [Pyrinomonadaceae bacterium]|nr:VWA domain-containing protein [Pyrinomonadaceae bacterium]
MRRRACLFLLFVCASLALGLSPQSAAAQELEPNPKPQATPYVRPRRTAAPQETPAPTPQPAPAPSANAQPQPAPTPAVNAQPSPAQAPEEVDEDEVVRVDSNLVIIPASVVDAFGRAITDLKVEDFELKIDGEVKTIGELTRSETPVHVALLFDNSYSLSAAREFEKQAAVRFFQRVIRPIDRAAVYSISNIPILSQGLTNDVPRLVRTIEKFGAPEGATALFEAVAQASEYMRPLPGRKVLVIVSDGADTVSEVSFDDAVNKALHAECQVYVVQTRQVEDPNLHDPVSEQRMYRLTEQTGGAVFVPRAVEELDAVFTQISLDLSQQYLLSYYPQDDRKDKYFRFISLRVKSRPTARVRARKGFYPDAAQAQTPDGRAQSASTRVNNAQSDLSTVPQRRAADTTPSSKREPVVTAAQKPAARPTSAPARGRLGPDGPDTEEAARRSVVAADSVPTFTVTVSAPALASKSPAATPPAAEPTSPAASERVAGNSLFEAVSNKPAETASAPATQPKPAGEPAPRPEKASDGMKSAAEARPAEASKPGGGEAPKAPLSGGVLNGKALRLPAPVYPSAARNSGAQGKVVVEVTIDEQGKVVEARAVSGHTFLLHAALQAARQARFTPALLSGRPVRVKGTINYVFTLP